MEEGLIEVPTMRRFAGIDLIDGQFSSEIVMQSPSAQLGLSEAVETARPE
jgi:hypothetical protein